MEVAELRRFAGIEPCHLRRLLDGAAPVREHPFRMRAELTAQHRDRRIGERHSEIAPALRLVGVDPR